MKHWIFGLAILLYGATCSAVPVRVVSLAPAVTETIFYLGAGEALVGRSRACDTPDEVADLPIAGDFGIADVEKILQLHPDVVVAHRLVNAPAVRTLSQAGIQVVTLACDTAKEYCNMVQTIGELLDRRDPAAKEVARVRRKIAQWEKAPRDPRKILIVVWSKPLIVSGGGTFCSEIVDLAGAQGVFGKKKNGFFIPDPEFLLQQQPDLLLCLFPETELFSHPILGKLRAVKEKNVIFLADADSFQRPSPRWCEAVDTLQRILKEKK